MVGVQGFIPVNQGLAPSAPLTIRSGEEAGPR